MAVGSNPALDSLFTVRNSSPGRPEPCEGDLVAAVGSCGRTDGKTSMAPVGNKSLRLLQASHVKYKYLPTYTMDKISNCYFCCPELEFEVFK